MQEATMATTTLMVTTTDEDGTRPYHGVGISVDYILAVAFVQFGDADPEDVPMLYGKATLICPPKSVYGER
jgi:hypothetical protein